MHINDTLPDISGVKRFHYVVNGAHHRTGNPIKQGREVLQEAGFNPVSDYVLIQITRPGTQSISLDGDVDLRTPTGNEFRAFLSDRIFTFIVDEHGYEWGARKITESELRNITGAPEKKAFVLKRIDQRDRIINIGDEVDLNERGTEHIRTTDALVTIIVEATPHKWPKGEKISYAQVVTLEFPDFPQHPERTYSVTYRKGEGQHHEGILAPGDSVKVKNGMEFNVTDTGQS